MFIASELPHNKKYGAVRNLKTLCKNPFLNLSRLKTAIASKKFQAFTNTLK